jgi:hypothetical protein
VCFPCVIVVLVLSNNNLDFLLLLVLVAFADVRPQVICKYIYLKRVNKTEREKITRINYN